MSCIEHLVLQWPGSRDSAERPELTMVVQGLTTVPVL